MTDFQYNLMILQKWLTFIGPPCSTTELHNLSWSGARRPCNRCLPYQMVGWDL